MQSLQTLKEEEAPHTQGGGLKEEGVSLSLDGANRAPAAKGNNGVAQGGQAMRGPQTSDAGRVAGYSDKCGVGLTFRKDARGYFTVIAVSAEVFATEGGPKVVSVGDTLVHAGALDVKGLNHAALAKLILGPPNSVAQLGFERADGSQYVTSITRSKVVSGAAVPARGQRGDGISRGGDGLGHGPHSHGPQSSQGPRSGGAGSESAHGGNIPGGSICDVGVRLRSGEHGHVVVHEVLLGGGASLSGRVMCGDVVLEVNRQIVTGMSVDRVHHLLSGPRSSTCLVLLAKRDGGREEVVLSRVSREMIQMTLA